MLDTSMAGKQHETGQALRSSAQSGEGLGADTQDVGGKHFFNLLSSPL